MRLTNHPAVTSIRATATVQLSSSNGPFELIVNDLPLTYAEDLELRLPKPRAKVLGPLTDSKGRIVRNEQTGRPEMNYDDENADFLRDLAVNGRRRTTLMLLLALQDGQLDFDAAQPETDAGWRQYCDDVWGELIEFGFGMSHINTLVEEIGLVSGLTDADIKDARGDFTSTDQEED